MKKLIIGFMLGLIFGSVTLVYAASRFVLVNGSGVELGTSTNPIHIVNI